VAPPRTAVAKPWTDAHLPDCGGPLSSRLVERGHGFSRASVMELVVNGLVVGRHRAASYRCAAAWQEDQALVAQRRLSAASRFLGCRPLDQLCAVMQQLTSKPNLLGQAALEAALLNEEQASTHVALGATNVATSHTWRTEILSRSRPRSSTAMSNSS
jgi:hypothetical protein